MLLDLIKAACLDGILFLDTLAAIEAPTALPTSLFQ
jgi:hypothetical protein